MDEKIPIEEDELVEEETKSVLDPLYIIDKKRLNNEELTKEEIEFFFKGYISKEIPDYQMTSLLMAMTINGLSDQEIIDLCDTFIASGEKLNLEGVRGVIVDKHSTGGVGDKTTFIIAPVLASCGVKICKMSGRSLGITGGTIDKLESIPGIKLDLTEQEIKDGLNKVGMVVCSQSDKLAPMDKEVYALRDVSGTVSSPALIAVSIMSKKIACSTEKIYIDLKVGRGALLKTEEEVSSLKSIFEMLGEHYQKEVAVEISNMNTPLGSSVGNALEVLEAMDVLQGKEKSNLTKISTKIIVKLLMMAKGITEEEALKEATEALSSGKAYNKFLEFIENQHGDIKSMKVAPNKEIIKSPHDGIVLRIDAQKIGYLVQTLGGGRVKKEDKINHGVGVYFFKTEGETIKKDEPFCTIFYDDVKPDLEKFETSFKIAPKKEEAMMPNMIGEMTPEMQQMMMQQMMMQQMMIQQMMKQVPASNQNLMNNLNVLNQEVPVAPTHQEQPKEVLVTPVVKEQVGKVSQAEATFPTLEAPVKSSIISNPNLEHEPTEDTTGQMSVTIAE